MSDQDDSPTYVLFTRSDLDIIYGLMVGMSMHAALPRGAAIERIMDRLQNDTGGDFREIANTLKKMELCAACTIEGVASSCDVHGARKLGRRLARLIERADGTQPTEQWCKETP